MTAPPQGSSLGDSDAHVVTAQIASLSAAGLPLAAGLRAAADEATTSTQASALRHVAEQIEQGCSLADALAVTGSRLSPQLVVLLRATSDFERSVTLLAEWFEQQRRARELTRAVRGALGYPLFVLFLAVILSVAIPMLVGPQFASMYEDFQLKLPLATRAAISLSGLAGWAILGSVVVCSILVLLLRWLDPLAWRTILSRLPLAGRLWYWSAVAGWSRLVALLLDANAPLPQAIQLAAQAQMDQRLTNDAATVAEKVGAGVALSNALADSSYWPSTAPVLIRWGEQSGQLAAALRGLAEVLETRVQVRSEWLKLILPSMLFVVVGYAVLFSYTNFILPMIELISKLS